MTNTQKEDQLVSIISQIGQADGKKQQIEQLLKSDLNWDYIIAQSVPKGIQFQLYYHLTNLSHSLPVPEKILNNLKAQYYANYCRNMLLIDQIKKILNVLKIERIETIVLKGIFLADNIFKNIALRRVGDIDILIKKKDMSKVNDILNSLGYQAAGYYEDMLHTNSGALNTVMYSKKQTMEYFVHIHWHLVNTTWPIGSIVDAIDMERVWSCYKTVKVDGIDALTLSAEHNIIYLTMHSFLHYNNIILLKDIAEVLKYYKDRINWDEVLQEARRFGLLYIVYHSLLITSRLLEFEIPQVSKLKPQRFSALEKIISVFIHKRDSYILSYLVYLSTQRGFLNKLRFIIRTILPSRLILAHNLNIASSKINILHYCKRLIGNLFGLFLLLRMINIYN